jgi:hypothetical protein
MHDLLFEKEGYMRSFLARRQQQCAANLLATTVSEPLRC